MRYPQVTALSLECYRDALAERRSAVSDGSKTAIDGLIETIDAAYDHGAALRPDEVHFGVTSLAKVPLSELPTFINDWTLGVGWDGAQVVVMGTEPAERPDSPEDMAWHAVYCVLVAAESRPEILDRIISGSSWLASTEGGWSSIDRRPYHLQANDFIHVERRGGNPTWKIVAQVVAPESAGRWHKLLETRLGVPGLGDYAYQIDRSALPSMTSAKGSPPSETRVAFLIEALKLVRETASVLLLHGFGASNRWPEWWATDKRLIAAFLEMDSADVELQWRYVAGRNSLGTLARDGRKVIYSRALSNRIRSAYVEALRREVFSTGRFAPPA